MPLGVLSEYFILLKIAPGKVPQLGMLNLYGFHTTGVGHCLWCEQGVPLGDTESTGLGGDVTAPVRPALGCG